MAPLNCLLNNNYMEVNSSLKEEALRLRREERLSLKDISTKTGISKSTLSLLLRKTPLTVDEQHQRASTGGQVKGGWNKKDRGAPSTFYTAISTEQLSNGRKARIAESAVLFRLAVHDFNVYTPVFDGDHVDWLVEHSKTGRLFRVQVRWVHSGKSGLPTILLKCYQGHSGRRKYTSAECDIIVGYDFFTDTAYVYRFSDLSHLKSAVTVKPDAAERWDLLF